MTDLFKGEWAGSLVQRSHYTAEKFENVVIFPQLGPPCTTSNPSRKWCFSKTFFKSEEFENAGWCFSCGRNTF